jgi:hypothetical protein
VEQVAGQPADVSTHSAIGDRLAGAPISWGACEVRGRLVLEQETAITGDEAPVGREPMVDVRDSIALHHNSALRTQEVNP